MTGRTRTPQREQRRCVVIGDVRESRLVEAWAQTFSRVQTALAEVNRRFAPDILVGFKPTVGDEFQGILTTPVRAYDVCAVLRSAVPLRLYFGIGVGAVDRPFATTRGMRGTAFYRARRAIDACKRRGRAVLVQSHDRAERFDAAVNALLHVTALIEARWTPRQRELLGFYRMQPHYSFQRLGKRFRVTKQAVSQILAAAEWETLVEAEAAVRTLLGSEAALAQVVKLQGFTFRSKAGRLYRD